MGCDAAERSNKESGCFPIGPATFQMDKDQAHCNDLEQSLRNRISLELFWPILHFRSFRTFLVLTILTFLDVPTGLAL